MRYGEAGQSHLLPFLGAAALFAALTIMAHSVVLGLAAVILKEQFTPKSIVGCALIAAGTLLMVL